MAHILIGRHASELGGSQKGVGGLHLQVGMTREGRAYRLME